MRKSSAVSISSASGSEGKDSPDPPSTGLLTTPTGTVAVVKHGDNVKKKAIKDVIFSLRKPEATTLNKGGVIVVPQRYKAPLKRSKQTVLQWHQGMHLW
jgi:hypothetical protein